MLSKRDGMSAARTQVDGGPLMPQVVASRGHQRLCAALQAAVSVDEVTAAYLEAVNGVIPAEAMAIYDIGSAEWWSTATEQLHEAYEEYGRRDDPVLRFVLDQRRPIDSSRVVEEHEWKTCGAREALGLDGLAHSMEAPLMVSGRLFGTLNFARATHRAPFTRRDLVSAQMVGEQLGLATERALRYEATGRRATALEQALDRVTQGVIVTHLDGQVLYQNHAARNAWNIPVDADGAPLPSPIGDCIAEALSAFRDDGRRVLTRNIGKGTSDRRAVVKSYRLPGKDQTAVTLLFPCGDGQSAAPRLPVWDALTRREQEIAQLVSEGLSTKQIAARAFISENTVKQHLKQVYAKTDVSTRAELVQLMWTSGQAAE